MDSMDSSAWTAQHGQSSMDSPAWTAQHGQPSMDSPAWTDQNGQACIDGPVWKTCHDLLIMVHLKGLAQHSWSSMVDLAWTAMQGRPWMNNPAGATQHGQSNMDNPVYGQPSTWPTQHMANPVFGHPSIWTIQYGQPSMDRPKRITQQGWPRTAQHGHSVTDTKLFIGLVPYLEGWLKELGGWMVHITNDVIDTLSLGSFRPFVDHFQLWNHRHIMNQGILTEMEGWVHLISMY